MSWCINQGPSFNNVLRDRKKLNGFYQRFNLLQSDNRMTPGKRQPLLPAETMKGTWATGRRKGTRTRRRNNPSRPKTVKPTDNIPKAQPMPIYSGFSNIKNKATSKIRKQGGRLKKRTIRQ
jgi:hypothetical protein